MLLYALIWNSDMKNRNRSFDSNFIFIIMIIFLNTKKDWLVVNCNAMHKQCREWNLFIENEKSHHSSLLHQ